MRRVWSTIFAVTFVTSSACGDEARAPLGSPSSGAAGRGGASGTASAQGDAGAAAAYLTGHAGVSVTATRGITCLGSCASTMAGPFLTSAGRVIVGGSLSGKLDLLDGVSHDTFEGGYDGYFGVLAPESLAVEAQRVLSGPASAAGLLATAAGDGVVVAGPLNASLDVGGAAPLVGDGTKSFIAAYDPSGKLRFARTVPAFVGGVLAGHRSGAFALAIYAAGLVDFGCGPIDAPLGSSLVVIFDPSGACGLQRAFGGFTNTTVVDALAFGSTGSEVALAGRFHDELTIDDRTLSHAGEASFVVDFLDEGTVRWLRKVETQGPAVRLSMVRDAFGAFVVTTMSTSALDFGWGAKPTEGNDPAGATRAHVARYDLEGIPLWHVALPAASIADVTPAVTPSGIVFVGGSFSGAIDLGDGLRESAGRSDAWLARLENGGAVRWSVRWGTAYDEGVDALLATDDALFVRGAPPAAAGTTRSAMTTVGISRLTRP